LIEPVNQFREWLVRMREPMAQRTIPVPIREPSMSLFQWFIIWLDRVEEAAKDLKGTAAKE
jgi:hypothetical protein